MEGFVHSKEEINCVSRRISVLFLFRIKLEAEEELKFVSFTCDDELFTLRSSLSAFLKENTQSFPANSM